MTPEPDEIIQIVAIDGPAGAGKSTVSREVARRLGMAFLDSGAMYRAATWWAMHTGTDLNDAEALVKATASMKLDMQYDKGGLRVVVDGHDISTEIRTPEVTNNIRYLDGIAGVRACMVDMQRAFGATQPTVAEGRDMGTVVFPAAKCKIFLDATIDERTRRRAAQLREQGVDFDEEVLREEIVQRDANDRNREVAPLRQAEDAHNMDTSTMDFHEVVETIVKLSEASM